MTMIVVAMSVSARAGFRFKRPQLILSGLENEA
jgi:hypothetical protein